MRGLEQLYYEHLPFEDPANPKPSEVENWFALTINLFRKLVGLTDMIELDQELFIKARFSMERQFTPYWDSYPGTLDSAYGPCAALSSQIHCGESFVPSDASQQRPYWNGYYCNPAVPTPPLLTETVGGAAEVSVFPLSSMFYAFSRKLRDYIKTPTGYGGHFGPYIYRSKFGFAFQPTGGTHRNIRVKFLGSSNPVPAGQIYIKVEIVLPEAIDSSVLGLFVFLVH